METPLTYAITLFARIISAIIGRRKKPAQAIPGAPPIPRVEPEVGWVRGGTLYRYVGRASTITVPLPSLHTQQAREDRGLGGVALYMTWADVASPSFSKQLIDQIKALSGEGGARKR